LAIIPIQQPSDTAIRRTSRRLVPFLLLMYIISFLDRANIGFAKQALETYVGITPRAYAIAAGLFFVSYSICGFPSNLILHKIGAKIWMTCIMVAWGLTSMATMFVTGSASLYALRLVLGVAEAGFFPGVILYLTYWFPGRVRGQIMGLFYLGVPLAMVIGSPLSGFLLEMPLALKMQNWQWMFLVEGLLAAVVGIAAYWYLDDRPASAKWLPPDEKQSLAVTLAREEDERRSTSPQSPLRTLADLRVLHFFLVYLLIQISVYGVVFYLPTQVAILIGKPAGLEVGLVAAIPWICAVVAVFWLPRIADRKRNHRFMAAVILLVAACASFAFPIAGPTLGLVCLSIAASGVIAVQPIFWTFPTGYLADRAAAGGIAVVTMGNLGGFFGPYLKVWAETYFLSAHAGLYLLAGLTLANAGLIAFIQPRRARLSRATMQPETE
jgi:MFS family permease